MMEGHYSDHESVVVVDDVLMTGGTLVEDIPVSSVVNEVLTELAIKMAL